MIIGLVDTTLEPVVPLDVPDTAGQPYPVDAIVDTAFTMFLALPPILIASPGLRWGGYRNLVLGNGKSQQFEIYAGVVWDGQPRAIEVTEVDHHPLIGTALLEGHQVRISVVPGGEVVIEALP